MINIIQEVVEEGMITMKKSGTEIDIMTNDRELVIITMAMKVITMIGKNMNRTGRADESHHQEKDLVFPWRIILIEK